MCVRKCTFSFLTNFAVHISPYYTECIWCFVGYLDIPTLIHPVIISSLFLHKTGSQWVELLSTGGAFLFSRVSNLSCYRSMYTVLHMFRQVLFGAGNQSNHQNFKKSLLSCKCGLIFIGMKQKKIFFWKIKFKIADSKKLSFSTPPIFNIFLQKFQGLVLGLVE